MKHALFSVLMGAVLFLTACTQQPASGYVPQVLRIGVLPDENEFYLIDKFSPLGRYLSVQLKRPYELIVPKDYAELVDRFEQGDFDLAYFGGLTFLQAQERAAAVPLVMRDVDAHFSSYFLVPAGSQSQELAQTEGARFAFGSPLSTSGHLMPRYFLRDKGIEPEVFFAEVRFSGAHDRTARWVSERVVDVGAVNSQIAEEMLSDGRLGRDEVRILWETPPYADYVWAVQAGLDEAFKQALVDSFLSLSALNPQHEPILNSLGGSGFLPASRKDFVALREVAAAQGLIATGETR